MQEIKKVLIFIICRFKQKCFLEAKYIFFVLKSLNVVLILQTLHIK